MAILLTGGTGKTSTRIAQQCLDANTPFVIASRKGQSGVAEDMHGTKFDWLDPSTFQNPFQHKFPNGEKIDTVYLVAPDSGDLGSIINPFIDICKEKGVKKFVYFTGSTCENGSGFGGEVWNKLHEIGEEYTVLRATWFMDNFIHWNHGNTIKNENKINSACGDGKIPFISANDIARMAFTVLTKPMKLENSYRLIGPELLTFDQCADILTRVLGRKIIHVKLSQQESFEKYMQEGGHSETMAKLLSNVEVWSSYGSESFEGDDVQKVTGQEPEHFEKWVGDNRGAWE
ncbi:hypothetical protein BJ875DRAFT_248469 [Amylocarpus encephaloides]|uniref:NmrA-like domain-containing protein n=1 Tax=Amylocarpus encephaloides TaxID=45428 RepID=A0A9P7YLZ9_9HELO|nr:hypothetical protein BJ875DRAFT_248469 [Amylocarpus encephaloides]